MRCPLSPVPPPFARPPLAALLAAADAPVVRVLCTGGVVWAAADGGWRPAAGGPLGDRLGASPAAPAGAAAGPRALDRWMAARAVRPVALASPAADGGERLALVSAAGALGWRPPLDELARAAAGAGPAHARLRRAAVAARPLVDAAEQHALDAAERYARAAAGAARLAELLGAPRLDSVGAPPGLFVAVDALAGAGLRTLAAAEALAAGAFGRGLLGAPPSLRAALLGVRVAHAAPAAAWRRVLRRRAAAGLGHPSVRVRRLRAPGAAPGAAAWAVRVPVGAAGGGGGDAFEAAWELATEAWRALALASYAAAGAWAFD